MELDGLLQQLRPFLRFLDIFVVSDLHITDCLCVRVNQYTLVCFTHFTLLLVQLDADVILHQPMRIAHDYTGST